MQNLRNSTNFFKSFCIETFLCVVNETNMVDGLFVAALAGKLTKFEILLKMLSESEK